MSSSPIFVLGAQRSGTTAFALGLQRVIVAHGGTFTVNGRLPYLLARWLTDADLAAFHLRSDDLSHLLRRKPPLGAGADEWLARADRALVDAASRVADGGCTTAVAETRRILAEAYGCELWGDKYNEYLLCLPELVETWPDARWIFLWRDPADVVSSAVRWCKPWQSRTAEFAAAKWAAWNREWIANRELIPRAQRVEVEYGEACAGDLQRIEKFVGMCFGDSFAHMSRPADSIQKTDVTSLPACARDVMVTLQNSREDDK